MRPIPVETEVPDRDPLPEPTSRAAFETQLAALRTVADLGFYASFFGNGVFDCRLDGTRENPVPRIKSANPDIKEPPRPDPFTEWNGTDSKSEILRLRQLGRETAQTIRTQEEEIYNLRAQNARLRSQKTLLIVILLVILGAAVFVAGNKVIASWKSRSAATENKQEQGTPVPGEKRPPSKTESSRLRPCGNGNGDKFVSQGGAKTRNEGRAPSRPQCLILNSSVPFTGQRIRSLAETQRRGDSESLRRFAGRFSIHTFGEESIPSFLAPNPARFFKMPLFSGLSLRTLRSWRLCVRTKRGI